MKLAILDVFSISIASILGAVLVLVSFLNEFFIGFFAYLTAIIMVVAGIYASKKWSHDTIAHIINIFVTSLVCINFTFSTTRILAGLILRYMGGFESQLMDDFAAKYALSGSEGALLLWTIATSTSLVFANRWANEKFRKSPSPPKKSSALEKLCASILSLTSSPINIVLVALLLIGSLYLAVVHEDISILAAAGGPITIIGLFSTIQFTTIEKYLKREELAANSTGGDWPASFGRGVQKDCYTKPRGRSEAFGSCAEVGVGRYCINSIRYAALALWSISAN
ncbi:hypothetical protein [Pseudomonas fluorescens]|uniref:Uncharacterized protein n=1 Tax=Pseudomonas fluorescens TaxID=294 RepID=A0A5E7CT61_PSEFL|nr:hypothetical protein [Pseudomonas fluorescens]VVO08339.1 hypothetical protein PS710_03239 [Pseudomonas fluorescens]